VPASPIDRVSSVSLPVSDQERALAFYRDQLGFEVSTDVNYSGGIRWVEVVPPGASTSIALNAPSDEHSGAEPGGAAGFSLETSDLDAAVKELSGRGVAFDEPMQLPPDVPPMAYFRDPDGNRVLLIQSH
jgi:catechol 2,3-dioxygenase-like lactoylglutathione lyase family enzyme